MGKAYLAMTTAGKCLFLEPMTKGRLEKYISNNSAVYPVERGTDYEIELHAKAETLSHYSYCRSGKQIMVLDIQGCGYSITDPEVATVERTDKLNNTILWWKYE